MAISFQATDIPLPKDWQSHVKAGLLHAMGLAHLVLTGACAKAGNSPAACERQVATVFATRDRLAKTQREMAIRDARMSRIPPRERPHYTPFERLDILALRAACGWSKAETARRFLVESPDTIAHWEAEAKTERPDSLVRLREPVNKYPQFVSAVARHLKEACPALGKAKITQVLARASLPVAVSTVGRWLKERKPRPPPVPWHPTGQPDSTEIPDIALGRPANLERKKSIVTAKYPNHLWQIDLTAVRLVGGWWAPWFPFALPQRWPFCWWVAFVLDHFSRRVVGFEAFGKEPTSEEIQTFLDRTASEAGTAPKHLLSDKGPQFWNPVFKAWCRKKEIRPRFGVIGKKGSIAVLERFIQTFKYSWAMQACLSLAKETFLEQCALFVHWYVEHRPHMTLGGRTPEEAYRDLLPANEMPRYETRAQWPPGAKVAAPNAPFGELATRLELKVEFLDEERLLPVVTLIAA